MSNSNRPTQGPGMLSGLISNAQLSWRLLNDDRVATPLKVIVPLLVGLYFISPIDFIPDFFPVVGQLDDLGIILLGMSMFINMAPKNVVAEHRNALGLDDSSGPGSTDSFGGSRTRRMDPNEVPTKSRPKVVNSTYREE